MSSQNGASDKMAVDERVPEPNNPSKTSVSASPHRSRGHRSRSRSRDRKDRHRDSSRRDRDRDRGREYDERRERERSGRDRRSQSRDRSHRDRDHRSERDRERRKERDSDRPSERDREYEDDRRDRRRKRDDEDDATPESRDKDERTKRRREDPDHVSSQTNGSENGRISNPDRARSRDSNSRPPRRDDRDDRRRDYRDDRGYGRGADYRDRDRRPPPPPPGRPPVSPPPRDSPSYELPAEDEPEEDSEARSVFVSQLAARLTARDLGYFFEDKLGEAAVRDARIVTDRISRRSKGIGYVELRSIDLVTKALELTGTIVMGLPIKVQLTEAERNRVHAGESLNLPPGVQPAKNGSVQLYVGSLHFNLTEQDIKQVFEPFGELENVDLHRDPANGRSKGYAFVHYKRADDAKMALEQMDGFELAGRTLRVNTVNEKGVAVRNNTTLDSLEDTGGGNLNAASRQALMQKLARIEAPSSDEPQARKHIPQNISSRSVLLLNMFDPDDETDANWDKDLADDVKGECETKYGKVLALKVEKDSQGEIYVKFETVESAKKAIDGLNGRWFGGQQISARFISDAIMQAHQ